MQRSRVSLISANVFLPIPWPRSSFPSSLLLLFTDGQDQPRYRPERGEVVMGRKGPGLSRVPHCRSRIYRRHRGDHARHLQPYRGRDHRNGRCPDPRHDDGQIYLQGFHQVRGRIPQDWLHGAHAHRGVHRTGALPCGHGDRMRTGDWITSLPVNRHIITVFIIFVYLIGGSFIDDLAFMILATPIFYPAIGKLGYDHMVRSDGRHNGNDRRGYTADGNVPLCNEEHHRRILQNHLRRRLPVPSEPRGLCTAALPISPDRDISPGITYGLNSLYHLQLQIWYIGVSA